MTDVAKQRTYATDNDCWISAPDAIERICSRLDVGVGEAQKILSDAYASGAVRKATGDFVQTAPNGELEYVSGQRVSWSDLERWLDKHYPAVRESQKGGAPAKAD